MSQPLVSIVMTYVNRRDQLLFTLQTISLINYQNIEVIIVDDASAEGQRLEDLINSYWFQIKLIRILPEKKNHINPCIAYNLGFKNASGDIIVIQDAEVCYIGDCISFIVNNLAENEYLSFNCYTLGNMLSNIQLYNLFDKATDHDKWSSIYNFIRFSPQHIGRSITMFNDIDIVGWINHVTIRCAGYKFMAALTRKTLNKIGGGFCELYKDGVAADDDDLVAMLTYGGVKFSMLKDSIYQPFVIHQYHFSTLRIDDETNFKLKQRNLTILRDRHKQMQEQFGIYSYKSPDPRIIDIKAI